MDSTDPWRLNPQVEGRARQIAEALLRRLSLGRARCYRALFVYGKASAREREIVLADLRDFCRADESVFSADALEMARRAGRREAWLRISKHLGLTDDQVRRLVPLETDDGR